MTFPRFAYRARQFWNALLRPDVRVQTESIGPFLASTQLLLFRRMQPSEQRHAYQVFRNLRESGVPHTELLTAALLHDVGKILSPLSVFDRILIVSVRYLFPKAFKRWGTGAPRGWRRPFVVAIHHSEWGADLAKKAGASNLTIELIRRHHEPLREMEESPVKGLLVQLHAADSES